MADAYSEWLEITGDRRPPTYYQLLGLDPAELNPISINAAADRQLGRLRQHEASPQAEECLRIASEITLARESLLDPVTRLRYDTITPDAADPWWKGEPDAPPALPEVKVDGWWEGESADPERPVIIPSTLSPEPEPSSTPEEPEFDESAKAADWWKAGDAEVAPVPPPALLPIASEPAPPPPVPVPIPAVPIPAPAVVPVGPVICEQSVPFPLSTDGSSPVRWVLIGVAVVCLVSVGAVVLTKPWVSEGPSPGGGPIAEAKTKTKIDPVSSNEPDVASATTVNKPKPKSTGTNSSAKSVGSEASHDPDKVVDKPVPKKNVPSQGVENIETRTFRGHKSGVNGIAISQNGNMIFSVSDDENVINYSLKEPEKHNQIHRLGSPALGVALCNDDRDVVFCDGGDAIVYELASGKIRASFENPRGGIRSLAAARDGSFVLTGTTDGCVRWWTVADNRLADTLGVDDKATVTAVAMTADAAQGVFGLSDGRLCVWDLRQRRETKRWKAHAGTVTAVDFAPDGQQLVSTGDDGMGNIWQPGGKLVQKLAGHEGPVNSACWCSDSRRVITGGFDRKVNLWDQDKGWKIDWSSNMPEKALSVAVDARGRFVLVGLSGGSVRLLPLPRPAARTGDTPGQ